MLLTLQLFLALIFSGTTPDFEQKAADYFFKNIIAKKYPDLKVAEFIKKTDPSLNFGIIMTCKHWDEETRKRIYSVAPEHRIELRTPKSAIKVKKYRKNTRKLKVIVSPKRKVGDKYFVEIMAFKRSFFIDYFIFQFDLDGRLVDICEMNEII